MDLTEILKDCPKDTEFYSPAYGNVKFSYINYTSDSFPIVCNDKLGYYRLFTKGGFCDNRLGGECMLFPSKDQRDWSKWHRPFVDGDIIAYTFWYKPTIYIYHENGTHNTSYYAAYSSENNKFYGEGALASNRDGLRFATEDEKQKLFDAIKANGYKWNAESKTLEKLIVPKFKVGDRIRKKGECWDGIIKCIDTDNFYSVEYSSGAVSFVNVKYQNEYELAPNKFDPKTLQPFDKVLVRDGDDNPWGISLFSHFKESGLLRFSCVNLAPWRQCVPYNDDTKHLVGVCDKAPEKYINW